MKRAAAVVAANVLLLWASYFWQAYDRVWALGLAALVGGALVVCVERSAGRSVRLSADWVGAWVGLPLLLILLTFNYFKKGFLLVRAQHAAAAATGVSVDLSKADDEARRAAAPKLTAALGDEDGFVRWGAVHKLWWCGQACEGAALPVARAILATGAEPPSAMREYLRRDGLRMLESRKADGVEGLFLVLREGDPELRRDAEYSLKARGVPLPEPRP